MSNLQDHSSGIPRDYLVPSCSSVDVALQSVDEVEDLLVVSPPKPVISFEDPPESLDDSNLVEDLNGKTLKIITIILKVYLLEFFRAKNLRN